MREAKKFEPPPKTPPPKFLAKPGKVSQTGEFELLFSTPCLVFGNGNLPGKDILKIKYQSDEGSENELADKGGAQKDEKKDNGRNRI